MSLPSNRLKHWRIFAMSVLRSLDPVLHTADRNEEIAMRNLLRPAPVFLLLILSMGLAPCTTTWAGSMPPASASLTTDQAGSEAVPAERISDSAIDALDRLIFRYENIHFNLDSCVLLPEGKRALNRKVAWLASHPEATVIVEGHCDARGSTAYNMSLGSRRAEAVRIYLIEQGIAPRRVQIVSWGKERPEAAGSGEGAWSLNRRAEFLPR